MHVGKYFSYELYTSQVNISELISAENIFFILSLELKNFDQKFFHLFLPLMPLLLNFTFLDLQNA